MYYKRGEDNSSDLCVDLNQIVNSDSSLPPVATKPKTQAQISNHRLKVETQHQGDCLHLRKTVTNSIYNFTKFLRISIFNKVALLTIHTIFINKLNTHTPQPVLSHDKTFTLN